MTGGVGQGVATGSWITPGWIDAIVAGVALEALVLGVLLAREGRAGLLVPLLAFLGSGAALLLALRAALSRTDAEWIGVALLVSGALHVVSLRVLWRARSLVPSVRRHPHPRSDAAAIVESGPAPGRSC